MRYNKIHAYIRNHRLSSVEEALLEHGIVGFSFCRVKGMGEYANYFTPDHLVEHVRLEIFVPAEKVEAAIDAIVGAASTHEPGDGLIAVMPVERIIRIRDRAEVSPEELQEEFTGPAVRGREGDT